MNLGEALPTTIRHFWPQFNQWLDRIPDSRFLPLVIYNKRFLIYWGLRLLISGKTQQRYENDHRRRLGLDSGWTMPRAHSPLRPVTRMWMRRAATSASSSLRTK